MKTLNHLLIGGITGAIASVIPDLALSLYGNKTEYITRDNPIVKLHHLLHSYKGILLIGTICYSLHIIVDWYTHPEYMYTPITKQKEDELIAEFNSKQKNIVI